MDSILPLVIGLAVVLFFVVAAWKFFVKAGEPGWAVLVPIYNLIVLLKIAGKPAWWFILMLIPGVSLVVAILVSINIAKYFGKGSGFAIGLILLGPIFYSILAFDSSVYKPEPKMANA